MKRVSITRRTLVAIVAGVGVLGAGALPPAAGAVTTTFGFSGGTQAFTVPEGVTSVRITAIGARGGVGGDAANVGAGAGGAPGFGGLAVADVAVAPGQSLFVNVGGIGGAGTKGPANFTTPVSGGAGGFNGGAAGGPAGGGAGRGRWRRRQ